MPRLAVYDSKNKTRLLGFITDVPEIAGPVLHLSMLRPLSTRHLFQEYMDDIPYEQRSQTKLSFHKEWITESSEDLSTWCYREFSRREELVLTTDASLADLTHVPSFEFPDAEEDNLKRYEEDLKESAFGLY